MFLPFAVLALFWSSVHACNFHHFQPSHPHLGRRQVKRAEGREVLDWNYDKLSLDWNTIRPEYALCQSGTSQSPISLHTSQGLAQTHTPDFSGYASQPETSGNFFNWGFGPAYTIKHEGTDFTTLPALKFDDRTVYLSGWHIHFPSEHLIDGVRSRAEMHMVHVDEKGEPAAVVGVRIAVASTPSPFVGALPAEIPHFNDTAVTENVLLSPIKVVEELGGVRDYWTYQGSLTTPPCSEGLRWFVPRREMGVSKEQMVTLMGSSKFSHRAEQGVWEQKINV